MSHTPGPWQVSGVRVKLGAEDCQVVGPDSFGIAFLPIGRRPHELAGALADARLIAAAPDLFQALTDMVQEHGKRGGPHDHILPAEYQEPDVATAMRALERAQA